MSIAEEFRRTVSPVRGARAELFIRERRARLARRQRWLRARTWIAGHRFELTLLAGYFAMAAVMAVLLARVLRGN